MDWQPISTIPQEGGVLLTTFPPGEDGYRIIHLPAHTLQALRERGLRGITHWMPEPPPPMEQPHPD